MPKASWVLPVYNKESWLAQTLKSIQAQTVKDIEIIIWNDGSTDNSMNIAKWFAESDPRIKVVGTDYNQGISKALNQAYKLVTSPYIVVASGDDVYTRFRTQLTIDFLNKHPYVDVVYGSFKRVDCQLNELENKKAVPWKLGKLFEPQNQYIPHGFMTIRTSKALEVKYREELKVGVDYPWLKDLETSGTKFRAIKSYLGFYRWYPTNVSHLNRKEIEEQGNA